MDHSESRYSGLFLYHQFAPLVNYFISDIYELYIIAFLEPIILDIGENSSNVERLKF